MKISSGLQSDRRRLIDLCTALMGSGEAGKAAQIVAHLLADDPEDPELQNAARVILSHDVADFHLPMLRDEHRNRLFERAIAKAVGPNTSVLDIGTGSGLLAMMAARAGARKIIACEANGALAATARAIVAANGYADKVSVVAKRSTDLDPDQDMGGRADVIISEVFSDNLVGEGALETLGDAMRRLAKPGAAFIPASATVRAALVEYRGGRSPDIGQVSGFDISAFNRHAPASFGVSISYPGIRLRSEPQNLFHFEFGRATEPVLATDCVMASRGGLVTGVVQWIQLQLDAGTSYDNQPGPDRHSHWVAEMYPFDSEIATQPGEELAVHARIEDLRLRIWTSGRHAGQSGAVPEAARI